MKKSNLTILMNDANTKLPIAAYHLGEKIDTRKINSNLFGKLVRSEYSFLLYQLNQNCYVYFKDYGSIVFINCTKTKITETLQYFLPESSSIDNLATENYTLIINPDAPLEVNFNTIQIPEMTTDTAHIIMLNLGQSVGLDNYFEKTAYLLEDVTKFSKQLEEKGNIYLGRKRMRQFIGKTMNLKNRIAENLFIFDTSTLAWSNEHLSKLDNELRKELDIINRHHGLQHNLNVVKENLDLFQSILQHKYSSLLEWIIILLILFEVLQLIIEKLV